MPDGQELQQIEYRHHETRDLSPIASSMSVQSRRGWDSQIRHWVRHPDADRLSESVCYQILPNGQAALAWRYWDQRAVQREDGTRGRPLVSRVLVGQASVLAPDVAIALCQTGPTADTIGPLPGEVPYDAMLPAVSGHALNAVVQSITPVLEQVAMKQAGLQAVVAAALADPHGPLAISVPDNLIQMPLIEGVQCPLLWGLRRIAGSLLGAVGRDWSFSTFEPPLGVLDPASLPSIVFRQVQEGGATPGGRWRREVRVSPLAASALNAGTFYADCLDLAGWLVEQYQDDGGDELQRLIVDCCGSEGSLLKRLERIHRKLSKPEIVSGQGTRFIPVLGGGTPAAEEAASTRMDRDAVEGDWSGTDEPSQVLAGDSTQPEPRKPGGGAAVGTDDEAAVGTDDEPGWPQADPAAVAALDRDRFEGWGETAPEQQQSTLGFAPIRPPMIDSGPHESAGHEQPRPSRAASRPAATMDQSTTSRVPPRVPQTQSTRPSSEPTGQQTAVGGPARPVRRHQSTAQPDTVSKLLERLELTRNDAAEFELTLQRISEVGRKTNDPSDRDRSWAIIADKHWYSKIDKDRAFNLDELTSIFGVVVIAELAVGRDTAGAIGRASKGIATWAADAPPLMIGGLLAAARKASPEVWQAVMGILEPVIAVRWAADNSIQEQWDARRANRSAAEPGHDDSKRGRNLFRKR
jgi:hypothetical protein